jgi:hypothetical protein
VLFHFAQSGRAIGWDRDQLFAEAVHRWASAVRSMLPVFTGQKRRPQPTSAANISATTISSVITVIVSIAAIMMVALLRAIQEAAAHDPAIGSRREEHALRCRLAC